MKRIAARGIILNGDELIFIHRIRMENNKKIEYYVFPGGGVEDGENLIDCITRELMEELGIEVNIIKTIYRLEKANDIEYYLLCEYKSGKIGSGNGSEFTEERQKERGLYIPESIPICKISALPIQKVVLDSLLRDMNIYGSLYDIPETDISD
jgi:mutator protein MutT